MHILLQFQLPTPPKYVGVHVESVVKLKPLYSLESAKFPSSVCKVCTYIIDSRRFQLHIRILTINLLTVIRLLTGL